ncbi:MAG: hypothetical protein M3032_04415 [Verrucomicrobiota bacterium]|nr:hypothetical protein [Verrucomicrobiota bacterium]
MLRRVFVVALLLVSLLRPSVFAYGPVGHQIIGEVADQLLANKPAGEKLRALLDGLSLQKASVIPDEIKGWDKNGPDAPGIFHYTSRPLIDAQLTDYWKANPPTHDKNSPVPSHHWFHYTDVSVLPAQRYADGTAGRSRWDVVHAMRYCIAVLQGKEPEDNPRKVTKAIAIILLAHFVGDLHQPLHVGAEYFNDAGQPTNPETDKSALEDQGGNSIVLRHVAQREGGRTHEFEPATGKFHAYWDNQAVAMNLPSFPNDMPKEERRVRMDEARDALVQALVRQEPDRWKINSAIETWPEAWADEILPIAREAHQRLRIFNVHAEQEEDGSVIAAGSAEEAAATDSLNYEDWTARTARDELHKAGWRLAELLEKALQ